ncbi:MAG: hypothetical protein LAP39_15740 [Acidobacteriia bacterium]|nr:hypothetical protein [Terriglobia bacterium]
MKLSALIGISFLLLPAFNGAARAQAITEYGSMASKTSTVGKRANSISNGIGGIWGSLDKTVKGSQDHPASRSASSPRTAQHAPHPARRRARTVSPAHEDPARIQPGIGYQELIRRFGPASFEVTTGSHTRTLSYPGKSGDIDVELLDEKVARIVPPPSQQVAAASPK